MSGLFLSTYSNKIDAKGRVSMPASFRDIITKEDEGGVVIYKSLSKKCLEGCTQSYIMRLQNAMDGFDPFSPEKDAFTTAIFSDSVALDIDKDGRITVPGFYDKVVELTPDERKMLARAPFDFDEYKAFLDINEVKGEKGYTTLERTGIRPSLDVCGIWGGYTGQGAKTVLPSEAHAKISMRLVPNQTSAEISKLFMDHFLRIAPPYVKVEVTPFESGDGFLIPISSDAYKAASRAIGEVYGIEPVPSRGGGSIPILAEFQKVLGMDPLLMGFGLERDTIHSPNESYLLRQFFGGMESIALFYKYF